MPSEQTGRGSVTSYLNKFCLQVVSRVVLIDVSLTLNQCCSRDPTVRDQDRDLKARDRDRGGDRSRDLQHCLFKKCSSS